MSEHWYCVRAKPRQEDIALAALQRLPGVEACCPRVRLRRRRNGRVRALDEALFPPYLFARFEPVRWRNAVTYAMGVASLVGFGGQPVPVPDDAMAELRRSLDANDVCAPPSEPRPGDVVDIVNGPFAGLQAVLTQYQPARQRVQVLLDFLGTVAELHLGCEDVLWEVERPLSLRP
jgi:transcriptional antiterminator RfaH